MKPAPAAREILPAPYDRWAADLLGGPLPREAQATCDACVMCPDTATPPDARRLFFQPATKCCTYVPTLYNFLAGQILSDVSADAQPGRATAVARLERRVAVTPLGLWPPPVEALLYEHTPDGFGRSRTLRCPHYLENSGGCGIWAHRESTCFTWFCKHVRGAVGHAFWIDALHALLQIVELELAKWCVQQLITDADTLRHLVADHVWKNDPPSLLADAVDGTIDSASYTRLWNGWVGREREFFERCGQLVGALSWSEVMSICGADARIHAQLAKQAYGRLLSDDLPQVASVGSFQIIQIERHTTRVSTYNDYDPLDVPNRVMEALSYFDGRPVSAAVQEIERERGIHLESDLIRKLVDFGILIVPDLPRL